MVQNLKKLITSIYLPTSGLVHNVYKIDIIPVPVTFITITHILSS